MDLQYLLPSSQEQMDHIISRCYKTTAPEIFMEYFHPGVLDSLFDPIRHKLSIAWWDQYDWNLSHLVTNMIVIPNKIFFGS